MTQLKAYHLPGGWGLVSVSPFCLKLDSFLRMAGIEHQSITAAAPLGGPKKKAPWIEHEGRTIGDSALIIAYLKTRFGVDPDAHLTPAQRGAARRSGGDPPAGGRKPLLGDGLRQVGDA